MRLFGFPEKGYRGEHFQNKPEAEPENRWCDMGCYYEGDLASVPHYQPQLPMYIGGIVEHVVDWPAYEPPFLGDPEAPNGWGA